MAVEESQVVDRDLEQELFGNLLKFLNDARLLTITDSGGRGKSTLLRKLRYNCDWKHDPPIASSLVFLEQLEEPDFFKLINQIREDLKEKGLEFPECELLFAAKATKQWTPFMSRGGGPVGVVDTRGATISGGVQAGTVGIGTVTEIERLYQYIMPTPGAVPWDSQVEKTARDRCIDKFFEDLKHISDQQPVVVILDTWDKCNKDLRNEILNRLVRPFCFDLKIRPSKFIMAVAGREPFRLKEMLGEQRFKQLVSSIESLSDWELPHVKDFLSVNGYTDLSDENIGIVFGQIKQGKSLLTALNLAKVLLEP